MIIAHTISWRSDGAHTIHQITDCFSDQQDIQNGSYLERLL